MTDDTYLAKLRAQLADVDAKIASAERRHDSGAPADKVAAAGELAMLRDRRHEISERMEQAAAQGAKDWSSLHAELETDLESLGIAVERWLRSY